MGKAVIKNDRVDRDPDEMVRTVLAANSPIITLGYTRTTIYKQVHPDAMNWLLNEYLVLKDKLNKGEN